MLDLFAVQGLFMVAMIYLSLALKVFAFVNALLHSAEAFHAAGKLTKPAWLAILGVALVAQLLFLSTSPIGLLQIAGTIAALVYIVDVRPAVAELRRR